MRLTRSVAYAVGVLLLIERNRERGPMTANRIARGGKFPPRFLYRILRRLVDAELLTGVSGPGGGYALTRRPSRISLLEIVMAVEGPAESHELEPVAPQHARAIRLINAIMRRSNADFHRQLQATSLQKLATGKAAPSGKRSNR